MEKVEYLDNSDDGDSETILGVIDEESEGSGGEVNLSHALLNSADHDVQYAFRNADGTITYRVLEVNDDNMEPMAGSSFASNNSQQTVLATPLNGQFYVIGNAEQMFSANSRSLAPRVVNPSGRAGLVHQGLKKRDDRRRATHNEVERRRRDKINNWIVKLGKIIPESTSCPDAGKGGTFEGQSKGGILAKACEYINELRDSNQILQECLKDKDRLTLELEVSRRQIDQLKRDNEVMRLQLSQHGILLVPSDS